MFFSTLRKSKDFEWTPACEQALQDLKRYLTSPPLLSKPKDGEQLYIYLAVSEGAVSAVLVREEDGKQFSVYYVSKSLLDAETRYTQLEKLAFALVTTARKLRPYFQCHLITVFTTYPLKSILHKLELSGKLTKWTVELSEYDITFQPRTALKSQVLADFVADFTPNDPPAEVTTIDTSDSWMTLIVHYLTSDELLGHRNEARRLWAKAARFTIHDGKLLKRSFSGPYLRYVTPVEASHILSELHDGECGNHSSGRSLANRALTAGYYWPTIRSDSTSHVKRCDSCQRFASVSHLPPE
ncbi:hypothetical protein UlMin_033026 [Ulmus minor]